MWFRDDNENNARAKNAEYRRSRVSDDTFDFLLHYLAEYRKYVEETVIYDKNYHVVMCIMRDVTEEENERKKKEELHRSTVAVTDQVIEKQMRVVQEIASLLGETTAETKIALTNLKDSLHDE